MKVLSLLTIILQFTNLLPSVADCSKGSLCRCDIPVICQAFSRADSVFVGKLLRIEPDKEFPLNTRIAIYEVEKVYKGTTSAVETVRHHDKCNRIDLEVGNKYFVFNDTAIRNDNVCDRTNALANSGYELQFAEKLKTATPSVTIHGRIEGLNPEQIKSLKVTVSKEGKTYSVKVAQDGYFEYVSTSPGDYSVHLFVPFDAMIYVNNLGLLSRTEGRTLKYKITLRPNECDFREIQITNVES